MLPGDDDIMKL